MHASDVRVMREWCIGQARDGSDACACVHDSKKRRKGESLKCVSLISRAKHTLVRGLWVEGRRKAIGKRIGRHPL